MNIFKRLLISLAVVSISAQAGAKEIYLHEKSEYLDEKLKNTAGIGVKFNNNLDIKGGIIYQTAPNKDSYGAMVEVKVPLFKDKKRS
jgi:vacuolar-type H+-ATPase subunit E/Vma4